MFHTPWRLMITKKPLNTSPAAALWVGFTNLMRLSILAKPCLTTCRLCKLDAVDYCRIHRANTAFTVIKRARYPCTLMPQTRGQVLKLLARKKAISTTRSESHGLIQIILGRVKPLSGQLKIPSHRCRIWQKIKLNLSTK